MREDIPPITCTADSGQSRGGHMFVKTVVGHEVLTFVSVTRTLQSGSLRRCACVEWHRQHGDGE
eukprot:4656861-Amphidinium_carterae.1